jgi:hypothetical protein
MYQASVGAIQVKQYDRFARGQDSQSATPAKEYGSCSCDHTLAPTTAWDCTNIFSSRRTPKEELHSQQVWATILCLQIDTVGVVVDSVRQCESHRHVSIRRGYTRCLHVCGMNFCPITRPFSTYLSFVRPLTYKCLTTRPINQLSHRTPTTTSNWTHRYLCFARLVTKRLAFTE